MDATINAYIETSFQKLRQLRSSDKGEVWLASDASGKLVIVKRIFLTGLPYRVLKEHQQSICPRVLYCAEDENETLVVEEFLQGDSLLERLEQGRYLTEQEAKSILLQLCDGLAPLHEQGIIHRDIKPSNLILQQGGIIRIIDFDAARTIKEDSREDTHLLGTKGYAPPEQFGYGQTDARSDIYSIGVTMKKLMGKEYRGYLTYVLSKCTEIDPQNRYDTVISLKRAILWRSRRGTIAASAAILMILLGTGLLNISNHTHIPSSNVESPSSETTDEKTSPSQKPEVPAIPQEADISLGQHPYIEKESASGEPKSFVSGQNPAIEVQNPEILSQEDNIPAGKTNSPNVIQQPVPVLEQLSNSPIETNFSLNGIAIGSSQGGNFSLDSSEWQGFHANLHVENNTNASWENPSIRIIFKDNWGGHYSETKSLPSLAPGEASDFSIPVGSYPVTNHSADTSAWLQVYLDAGNLPITEHYWCVQFQLHKDETLTQDGTSS